MTFTNRAIQGMSGFAVKFNKNSFGLLPNQSCEASLPVNTTGPVCIIHNFIQTFHNPFWLNFYPRWTKFLLQLANPFFVVRG